MTYSIIDTREFSGEIISTHKTLKSAQRTWEKVTAPTRDVLNGKPVMRESIATRWLRIRNNKTGNWARNEINQPLPADAADLLKLIADGGYTQLSAANAIAISPRMMRYYVAGEKTVPHVVMLAMKHLVHCPPHD